MTDKQFFILLAAGGALLWWLSSRVDQAITDAVAEPVVPENPSSAEEWARFFFEGLPTSWSEFLSGEDDGREVYDGWF